MASGSWRASKATRTGRSALRPSATANRSTDAWPRATLIRYPTPRTPGPMPSLTVEEPGLCAGHADVLRHRRHRGGGWRRLDRRLQDVVASAAVTIALGPKASTKATLILCSIACRNKLAGGLRVASTLSRPVSKTIVPRAPGPVRRRTSPSQRHSSSPGGKCFAIMASISPRRSSIQSLPVSASICKLAMMPASYHTVYPVGIHPIAGTRTAYTMSS